jgi:hypothetical protein
VSAHQRTARTPQPPAPFGLSVIETPRLDPDASVRDAGQHLFSLFKDEILRFDAQRRCTTPGARRG